MIRQAKLKDIDRLLEIEQDCFRTDQLSRRNFRYLLTKANAQTIVDEVNGAIRGYAMLLFRRGTATARLYSFATAAEFRRQGVGIKLLTTVEEKVKACHCFLLRLETQSDNLPMQQLVKNHGYQELDVVAHFYQDGTDAIRFEKYLVEKVKK